MIVAGGWYRRTDIRVTEEMRVFGEDGSVGRRQTDSDARDKV